MSQRCHWNANEVGVLDHVPSLAESSWPTRASPVITGRDVLMSGGAFAPTTSDCSERAVAEPSAFDARTRTRTVLPTSAGPSRYVWPSAASATHELPSRLQRNQRYANVVGELSHVPRWAVSASPTRAVPVTVGGSTFAGTATGAAVAAVAAMRLASDNLRVRPRAVLARGRSNVVM